MAENCTGSGSGAAPLFVLSTGESGSKKREGMREDMGEGGHPPPIREREGGKVNTECLPTNTSP